MNQARRVEVRLNPNAPFEIGDEVWVIRDARSGYKAEITYLPDPLIHMDDGCVVKGLTEISQMHHVQYRQLRRVDGVERSWDEPNT